jgi:hypothetical protein
LLGIYGTLIGLIELIFISVNQRLRSICVNQRSDFWNADATDPVHTATRIYGTLIELIYISVDPVE